VYRLRVLGGFALEGQGGTVIPRLPQRRAEAVLAMLAVCGDVGCTRERLIAMLWPESDEAHSRHGLRDALHAIRHALGKDAVVSVGDVLRLDPSAIQSDVHEFGQALKAGRRGDAVRAYGGPLLDGFHVDGAVEYERWLDGERSRLARECSEALVQLAHEAEAAGARTEAAGWWARAVEQDPLNSHFVLQHVRALAAMRDRANAIKVADEHARRLRDELDLDQDEAVLDKIQRVRRGELITPPELMAEPALLAARPPRPGRAVDPLSGRPDPPGLPAREREQYRVLRWILWVAGIAAIAVVAAALRSCAA